MILRINAVAALIGISRATVYRMVKAGNFPAQVQISPGAVGWREAEVGAWIASRPRAGTQGRTHGDNLAEKSA